jgi:hypothetical protein
MLTLQHLGYLFAAWRYVATAMGIHVQIVAEFVLHALNGTPLA